MTGMRREFVLHLDDDPAAMPALFAYLREVSRLDGGRQSEDYRDAQALAYADGHDPWHQCHFCGTDIAYGYEYDGRRHFLSDCRPDLVKHDPGPLCTWSDQAFDESRGVRHRSCYAYQDFETQEWTDKHEHFHADGPM